MNPHEAAQWDEAGRRDSERRGEAARAAEEAAHQAEAYGDDRTAAKHREWLMTEDDARETPAVVSMNRPVTHVYVHVMGGGVCGTYAENSSAMSVIDGGLICAAHDRRIIKITDQAVKGNTQQVDVTFENMPDHLITRLQELPEGYPIGITFPGSGAVHWIAVSGITV